MLEAVATLPPLHAYEPLAHTCRNEEPRNWTWAGRGRERRRRGRVTGGSTTRRTRPARYTRRSGGREQRPAARRSVYASCTTRATGRDAADLKPGAAAHSAARSAEDFRRTRGGVSLRTCTSATRPCSSASSTQSHSTGRRVRSRVDRVTKRRWAARAGPRTVR
ncbi:hypothetical protein QJS66_10395 [Kocuria rhizophila]|nr:hypothetical protein QJS66_10395 [Kocuria rhizophila]